MYFYVLNKNENIINAGYWVLSENRKKLNPSEKNQSALITKISWFPSNTKNRQSAKINSRKNFVSHGNNK